jgi:hypothetical protein
MRSLMGSTLFSIIMPDIKYPKCDHPKCGAKMQRVCINGLILLSYHTVGFVLIAVCSKKTIRHTGIYQAT